MKSINTDAWLVNLILFFSGLSLISIGPKVIFLKLTWHKRPQQCEHLLDSTQSKRADPIKFHLKKLQLDPAKSFSRWTTSAYRNSFGLNPATNRPNLFYDAYDLSQLACHIGCHIRFCPAWQSCRTELMTHCIDNFPRVIKLMTPRNKVSSLIAVCDARLMTEHFRNNRRH
jgi:hypothetical protein